MTIDDKGFLSEEMANWIDKHRGENAKYFNLCEDINKFSQKTMLSLEAHNKCLPEILLASLLVRAVSNFQGIILLIERGMKNESETLLRCLLEIEFAARAILKNPKFALDLVNNDLFDRKRCLNACTRSKDLKQEEIQLARKKVGEIIRQIKRMKLKEITTRDMAKKADLIGLYDSAYRKLCGSIHAGVHSLEQYLETNKSGEINRFLWGPDTVGIDIVLLTAAESILYILNDIFQVFSIAVPEEYNLFSSRFQTLWNSFCKLQETQCRERIGN
jgi:hypothetical protein